MRRYLLGLTTGLLLGLPLIVFGAIPPESEGSPVQYQITENVKVTRVFDASTGEWITEIWPSRCTVFEDGSADCPSYFE